MMWGEDGSGSEYRAMPEELEKELSNLVIAQQIMIENKNKAAAAEYLAARDKEEARKLHEEVRSLHDGAKEKAAIEAAEKLAWLSIADHFVSKGLDRSEIQSMVAGMRKGNYKPDQAIELFKIMIQHHEAEEERKAKEKIPKPPGYGSWA